MRENTINSEEAIQRLQTLRANGVRVSYLTDELLSLTDPILVQEMIEKHKETPLVLPVISLRFD
jgi:hypothetical protein